MPLTKKGKKTKKGFEQGYMKKGKTKKEADSIFYAWENKNKGKGVVKGKAKSKK